MSNEILDEIETFVGSMKKMTQQELMASRMDIVFGRLIFSTDTTVVTANTVELHDIKIRIILDGCGEPIPIAMRYGTLVFTTFSDKLEQDRLIACLNEIYSIIENVSEMDISELTNGMFDYHPKKDDGSSLTNSL